MTLKSLFISSVLLLISPMFRAQTPCDGIQAEVFVHPVLTELVVVKINYSGATQVNYPSVSLLLGDEVIAEGETFFFALPQGESFHLLEPSVQMVEDQSYDFTLELYSVFGETLECSFDVTDTPYDISACFTGDLMVSPIGGASQEIEIIVTDENGSDILSENLELSSQNPFAIYSLCLERACHSVSVEAVGSTFETDYLVSFDSGLTWFSGLCPEGESITVFELDVWDGCSFVGIREAINASEAALYPEVALAGSTLRMVKPSTEALAVTVYSMSGQQLAQHTTPEWQAPLTPGIYLIHYEAAGFRGAQKLLVLR